AKTLFDTLLLLNLDSLIDSGAILDVVTDPSANCLLVINPVPSLNRNTLEYSSSSILFNSFLNVLFNKLPKGLKAIFSPHYKDVTCQLITPSYLYKYLNSILISSNVPFSISHSLSPGAKLINLRLVSLNIFVMLPRLTTMPCVLK